MSGSQTNEVETFLPERRSVSVRVSAPWKAARVKAAVGTALGLQPASLALFGLFRGLLEAPISLLADNTVVAPNSRLCFRRWNIDLSEESQLCRHDDAANHLLYSEARHHYERGGGGGGGGGRRMRGTPEQASQLEDLSDPAFPAERQFLDLARRLPGYGALVARGVVMETDLVTNDLIIKSGKRVDCLLERQQFFLITEEGGGEEKGWNWELIKRWRTERDDQLSYEISLTQGNASILTWIHLKTPQAYYLRAGSELICHHRNRERMPSLAPRVNPGLAGKPFNPLVEFLNSELFKPPNFSSVDK